jgi:hypothetical protein
MIVDGKHTLNLMNTANGLLGANNQWFIFMKIYNP